MAQKLIVEGNDAIALAKLCQLRGLTPPVGYDVLSEKYSEQTLVQTDLQQGAKVLQESDLPTVGVWIMPDNTTNGYLEHFLAGLVPTSEELWTHANLVLKKLFDQDFNEITPAKSGKALLHTWLAWKKDPGKPFGQALDSKYLNIDASPVDLYLEWFKATFKLSS